MRALVVFESLARVPKQELLFDMLDRAGVPRAKLNIVSVILEDTKDIKSKHIKAALPELQKSLGEKTAVLLVGNVPLEAVTGKKGIKQKRGHPFEQDGNIYVPMLPPGMMLYDERVLPMLEADARLFADVVRKGKIPREEALDWTIVDTRKKFDEMLTQLRGTVSFDIETNGLYPWPTTVGDVTTEPKIISIGIGTMSKQWCLPLLHPEAVNFGLTREQMMAMINRRMQDCYLVAQNGKFDSLWLKVHYGLNWRVDFDTMLAHWMLDENQRHGLKLLAQLYCGAPNYDADLDTKTGAGPLYPHCMYLAHDVYYTRVLRFKFGKMLDEDLGVKRAFEKITMPIARLFVDIEFQGVFVDYDRFEEAEVSLRRDMAKAEKDLHECLAKIIPDYTPGSINWRSPQQLAKLFFDTLKLKVLDRTEKGAPSTNESVLMRLDHPAAVALRKFRTADQMLKMFIDGWRPFLVKHPDGWRLHPSFKLHGTVTGRASCEHPNLQQVPRDSLIRSLIMASLGWDLLEVDLSQIEMRIAAELSGDQTLLGIFDKGEDVHWMTALKEITRGAGMAEEIMSTAEKYCKKYATTPWLAELKWKQGDKLDYGKAAIIVYRMGPELAAEISPAWKELRKKAKAINFGYLFGMWWKKMVIYARDNYGVHLTDKQAQESRKNFFDTYPRLAEWHDRQKRYARRHGHVRSLSGALRRLPHATSHEDTPERGEALRQAVNSPVQRFACELNFMAMLQLCDEFGWDKVRPVGTVHDAILIETRHDWTARVYTRALEIMRGPKMLQEMNIRLRVPIMGEAKIGNWSKGVGLEKWLTLIQSGKAKSKTTATVAKRTTTSMSKN